MDKSCMDQMISSYNSNEYYNSISHLIGAIASIAGFIVLLVFSITEGSWYHTVSFSIYGVTLFLSLFASCLLHFNLLFNRYRRILGVLDHAAIYLLIAGSYTPFCLVVLKGTLGWTIFGVVWCLAAFNISLKAIFFKNFPKSLSTASYVLMGWLMLIVIYKLFKTLDLWALVLIFGGGLVYTVGSIIFTTGKPDPYPPNFGNHEIWHTCVLIGNLCMYFVMLFFVLPIP